MIACWIALGLECFLGHSKVYEHYALPEREQAYGIGHQVMFLLPLLLNGVGITNLIGIAGVCFLHLLWEYQADNWLSRLGYGKPDVILALMAQGEKRQDAGAFELMMSLMQKRWLSLGAHVLILGVYQGWLGLSTL